MEGTTSTGRLKFRGKFQESGTTNKNKRMYTHESLDANVKRLTEVIKGRGLVGELDHPTDSIIHFEKASHLVTRLWWEGNSLMGEAEILPTPHGQILRNLIESGVRCGISSRGVGQGKIDENTGVLVIDSNFRLITFDCVADPSTNEAFQKLVATKASPKQEESVNISNEVRNSSLKNESTGIDTINSAALLMYSEAFINSYINKFREQKNNKRG